MKQLEFKKVKGWGGKRRGAGRKNRSGHPGHLKRPDVDFRKPLHINLKVRENRLNLRTDAVLKKLKEACEEAQKFRLHVIHFALLRNHLHLIVEAKNNESLMRGMKSINGRMGKFVAKMKGGGPVWAERFFLHVLKTPTEMKNALKYVLLNFSKHEQVIEHLDKFSSGRAFLKWRELMPINRLLLRQLAKAMRTPGDFGLSPPRSWLAREGWLRGR